MTAQRLDPAAFRRVLFETVGYTPHPGQRPVHDSRARHRVVAAGRRFGKSMIGGHELVAEAARTRLLLPRLEEAGDRREFWIVGPEYTDSEKEFRVAYDALRRLDAPFDRPGTRYNPLDGELAISLYGGRFIVLGKSAMHPERLVGEGLAGVVMAEAAKQRERTWTKYVRPMLADRRGWSLHVSTPEGRNWFYGLWMRGQDTTEPDWASWRAPSWLNPVVYPLGERDPEIAAQRTELSEETFNQEVAADFTEFAGRVFKDFSEEEHVADLSFMPGWPTYAACDYGFTNPFVWLVIQVSPHDGTVYVLDEMYERGLTIDEAAAEISARRLVPAGLREFFPDPASPGDSRTLEQRLKIRSRGGTGGELDLRLRLIRAGLRTGKLIINRRCLNTIRELSDYRYPATRGETSNSQEKPLKKDDHTPEALGRFYAGHFGRPVAEGAYISNADLSA